MIFRQLMDPVSSTYTYLLAERKGGDRLLVEQSVHRIEPPRIVQAAEGQHDLMPVPVFGNIQDVIVGSPLPGFRLCSAVRFVGESADPGHAPVDLRP